MGVYSELNLKVLDFFVDLINTEFFLLEDKAIYNSRFEYSLCLNVDEERELTVTKINLYKLKLKKIKKEISIYLVEFSNPIPENIDYYSFRDEITKNFFMGFFEDIIEEFTEDDLIKYEDYNLYYILKQEGYDKTIMENYINGVFLVNQFNTYKEILEINYSNGDLLKHDQINPNSTNISENKKILTPLSDNPYPNIFISAFAYSLFEKLHEEFGDTKSNIANYSFVYRKMIDDGLIFNDIKHRVVFDFLASKNIFIDKFKTKGELSNKSREQLYNQIKNSMKS